MGNFIDRDCKLIILSGIAAIVGGHIDSYFAKKRLVHRGKKFIEGKVKEFKSLDKTNESLYCAKSRGIMNELQDYIVKFGDYQETRDLAMNVITKIKYELLYRAIEKEVKGDGEGKEK